MMMVMVMMTMVMAPVAYATDTAPCLYLNDYPLAIMVLLSTTLLTVKAEALGTENET